MPSAFIRRFDGDVAQFRKRWDQELMQMWSKPGICWRLQGRWLKRGTQLSWRGGLEPSARHEIKVVEKTQRLVICLDRSEDAGITFAEIHKFLADWTWPDDVLCVPAPPPLPPSLAF